MIISIQNLPDELMQLAWIAGAVIAKADGYDDLERKDFIDLDYEKLPKIVQDSVLKAVGTLMAVECANQHILKNNL